MSGGAGGAGGPPGPPAGGWPPFQPKGPGGVPEWRILYDALLTAVEPGDLVTYDAIQGVLGRDLRAPGANRQPVYTACEYLGEERHRWLQVVPNRGYRVIESNEHTGLALNRRKRARRQIRKGQMVLVATDLSRLTQEEMNAWDSQSRINAAVAGVLTSHEKRLNRLEQALRAAGLL